MPKPKALDISPDAYVIRHARRADLDALPAIEVRAGALFAEVGLTDIADHEPGDVEFLDAFLRAGAVHVAVSDRGEPVGFGLTGLLDGCAHLYELAVDPAHGKRGLGARLVAAGCAYGVSKGCRAITLSTFRDLPWNGPFYARLGFAEVMRPNWTPGMHVLHAREADMHLPLERRYFMRKEL